MMLGDGIAYILLDEIAPITVGASRQHATHVHKRTLVSHSRLASPGAVLAYTIWITQSADD